MRELNNNRIEFKIVNDIMEEQADGTLKTIKKGVLSRISFHREDVLSVSELLSERGRLYKSLSKINIRELGALIVKDSYDTVNNVINKNNKIGFIYGKRNPN